MATKDSLVSSAIFDGGNAVQAFSLGGRASAIVVKADAARSLEGVVAGPASLVMLVVPELRTLFVGHRSQVAGKTVDQLRALFFPLPEGAWTFTLTDLGQADLVLLADTKGDLDLRILAAASVGGDA